MFCLCLSHCVLHGYFIDNSHQLFLYIKFKSNHKAINTFSMLPSTSTVMLEILQDSSLATCSIQITILLFCSNHTFSSDFLLHRIFYFLSLCADNFLFFPPFILKGMLEKCLFFPKAKCYQATVIMLLFYLKSRNRFCFFS